MYNIYLSYHLKSAQRHDVYLCTLRTLTINLETTETSMGTY